MRSEVHGGGSASYPAVVEFPAEEVSAPARGWGSDADEIWAAWRSVADWEALVDARFDLTFGRHLLVLWALHTFRGAPTSVLDELIGEDLEPRFGDPLIEDMARLAFALGAAWATAQEQPPVRLRPRLEVRRGRLSSA